VIGRTTRQWGREGRSLRPSVSPLVTEVPVYTVPEKPPARRYDYIHFSNGSRRTGWITSWDNDPIQQTQTSLFTTTKWQCPVTHRQAP